MPGSFVEQLELLQQLCRAMVIQPSPPEPCLLQIALYVAAPQVSNPRRRMVISLVFQVRARVNVSAALAQSTFHTFLHNTPSSFGSANSGYSRAGWTSSPFIIQVVESAACCLNHLAEPFGKQRFLSASQCLSTYLKNCCWSPQNYSDFHVEQSTCIAYLLT